AVGLLMAFEEPLDAASQGRVAGAGPVEEGRAFGRVSFLQCLGEDRFFLHDRSLPPTRLRVLSLHAPSGSEMRTDSRKRNDNVTTGPLRRLLLAARRGRRPRPAWPCEERSPAGRRPRRC